MAFTSFSKFEYEWNWIDNFDLNGQKLCFMNEEDLQLNDRFLVGPHSTAHFPVYIFVSKDVGSKSPTTATSKS